MSKADHYIKIGKIGSTYGIHGWLKIQSYAEFGASIFDYQPWYISTSQQERIEIRIEDSRIQHDTLLAKFPSINTPEEARTLASYLIEIKRSQLPPLKPKEYYWSDLEGLTVLNTKGEILGKVIYLMETGSNDVIVIKGTKEYGIPYLSNVILHIDLEKQEMIVDWELI